MWPGWGVWGQRVVTEYCVWGRGGCWTLRPERVHRRSSPRRPALTPVPYWRACPLEAEPRAAPPTRARGLGGTLLPAGAVSSALSPSRSCSASRLRFRAPTTCSTALPPRKLGGREEREEETGGLPTPSSLHSEQPEPAAAATAPAAAAPACASAAT